MPPVGHRPVDPEETRTRRVVVFPTSRNRLGSWYRPMTDRYQLNEFGLDGLSFAICCIRLQLMKVGHGLFCKRCRLKYCALVILQNGQPRFDISSVIITRLDRQAEICGKENASQLGNQLLACVAFVAP